MKYSKLLFTFLLGVFCFYSPNIQAAREMSFPDNTAIQPMPTSTLPNISGNIDWPNAAGSSAEQSSENNPANPNTVNANNNATENYTGFPNSGNGNGAQNNTGSPSNTSASDFPSSNPPYTKNSPTKTTVNSGGQNNYGTRADSTNFPSAYNFDAFPTQGSAEVQNTPIENNETTNGATGKTSDSSSVGQTQTPTQKTASQSLFVWILTFGSIILFIVAFILWKLKKTPDDVNQ